MKNFKNPGEETQWNKALNYNFYRNLKNKFDEAISILNTDYSFDKFLKTASAREVWDTAKNLYGIKIDKVLLDLYELRIYLKNKKYKESGSLVLPKKRNYNIIIEKCLEKDEANLFLDIKENPAIFYGGTGEVRHVLFLQTSNNTYKTIEVSNVL